MVVVFGCSLVLVPSDVGDGQWRCQRPLWVEREPRRIVAPSRSMVTELAVTVVI